MGKDKPLQSLRPFSKTATTTSMPRATFYYTRNVSLLCPTTFGPTCVLRRPRLSFMSAWDHFVQGCDGECSVAASDVQPTTSFIIYCLTQKEPKRPSMPIIIRIFPQGWMILGHLQFSYSATTTLLPVPPMTDGITDDIFHQGH